MVNKSEISNLLEKIESATRNRKLDLSSDEDLSIGIMNLISIEEHLFFTSQKTGKPKYLDLLNEVRQMRTDLMKKIIRDYEGEVWCISKHLLSATMRLTEVGTKELKKGNKKEAWDLFEKAYKLYSLFWGINLDILKMDNVKIKNNEINYINESAEKENTTSIFSKMGKIVQKAVDCCKE